MHVLTNALTDVTANITPTSYGEWLNASLIKRVHPSRPRIRNFARLPNFRLHSMLYIFILYYSFRHARSTMLETVLDTLAICELLRPDNRQESTKVVISRKVPLRLDEVDDLYKALCTYGRVQTFFVNNRQTTTIGAFCEVTYTYVSQAHLAMIMTNGLMYNRGILTASIDKTHKDREILKDAKDLIVVLYQSIFPN